MSDHKEEAERILTPLMPDEIRALQDDRSLQLIIIGANVRAQAIATLALVEAADAQVAATIAQTAMLERLLRAPRVVGL